MNKRIWLITGVTKGIGRALLEECVKNSDFVVGCGRSDSEVSNLRETYGDKIELRRVDVSDSSAVIAWARQLASKQLLPDILVNNAGVINDNAPLWEISDEQFRNVLDVNVCGTVNTIRAFMPFFIERDSGTIVNMSSGWGRSTAADVAPYCASKWAIEGLTGALAQEVPESLCCVALNPGVIHTDMLASCFGDEAAGYQSATEWAQKAYPMLAAFSAADNGMSLSV